MLIGHTPRCIDGARQQLTTGRKFRECSLRAQQGLLRAHANNLQLDEEFGGRRVEVSFRNSFLEIHEFIGEVSHLVERSFWFRIDWKDPNVENRQKPFGIRGLIGPFTIFLRKKLRHIERLRGTLKKQSLNSCYAKPRLVVILIGEVGIAIRICSAQIKNFISL